MRISSISAASVRPVMIAGLLCALALPAQAERIKDLARLAGMRDNQLVGYGLVVGLDGSGDQTGQTPFTVQSLKSYLNRLGVRIPPGQSLQLKNVAAVSLHAVLPPFAKPGQTIDVTVSTIGNAKSLRGGSLLMSPLIGADGRLYAMAQGNLVVAGLAASTGDGDSVTVNVPTAGRIPNGASVELAAPTVLGGANTLTFNMHRPDFTTARRIVEAINTATGKPMARAIDAMSVEVNAPANAAGRVDFVASIENLSVDPGEGAAKVIVSARTGTVVIGSQVRVTAAAVSHGNLAVTISSEPVISQPGAFSSGSTVETTSSEIDVQQSGGKMFVFQPGVSLDDIVRAVNQVGAGPMELVAILEALKEAGALHAELIVI